MGIILGEETITLTRGIALKDYFISFLFKTKIRIEGIEFNFLNNETIPNLGKINFNIYQEMQRRKKLRQNSKSIEE